MSWRGIAIETSGRLGSIAVVVGDKVLSEKSFAHGLAHAAQIIPIIDQLIRAQNWSPREIEHLYVSIGPGSFTGLRIAATLAKTFAFVTGAKIVAVPGGRVLVENAPIDAKNVILVLDAKRDEIFTARFERVNDEWIERESARVTSLTDAIARSPRPLHLLGEGIPFHEKFIPKNADVIVTLADCWTARAAAVARVGFLMAHRGEFTEPQSLAPIYIRRPEAEEKWLRQNAARDSAND